MSGNGSNQASKEDDNWRHINVKHAKAALLEKGQRDTSNGDDDSSFFGPNPDDTIYS